MAEIKLAIQLETPEGEAEFKAAVANDLLAAQYAGMIRGMASTFGQVTWMDTVNFPNCLICEPLLDTTTDDNMQSDDNYETTRLSFSGIVQIRTAVWNN